MLAEMYKRKNMMLLCCFIDFRWLLTLLGVLDYRQTCGTITFMVNLLLYLFFYNDIMSFSAVMVSFLTSFLIVYRIKKGREMSLILFSIFIND